MVIVPMSMRPPNAGASTASRRSSARLTLSSWPSTQALQRSASGRRKVS